jgi:hypothetical protein
LAREQLRNRLEKRALTQRLTAISLDMVRAEIEAAGPGAATVVPAAAGEASAAASSAVPAPASAEPVSAPIEWEPAAFERAQRIPEFIRAHVIQQLEKQVRAAGRTKVVSADLDTGMKHMSREGRNHGQA